MAWRSAKVEDQRCLFIKAYVSSPKLVDNVHRNVSTDENGRF